jgi:oligosaccharide translocation protein RFT1
MSDLLQKSFKNVGILMLVQVFSKIMTFTLNFLVARIVVPEVYGYANIQLQLYGSIVLWFLKESVRKAVQRKIEGSEAQINKSAINIVVISFGVQIALAAIVYLTVTRLYPMNFESFNISIALTVVASLVESFSEPFYVKMLLSMEFGLRAKAESGSIFVKTVLIYYLVSKGYGLLAYALS